MNKENIVKAFDVYATGKRQSSIAVRLMFALAAVVVVGSLVLVYSVSVSTANKIRVLDRMGNTLPTVVVSEDKLKNVLLQAHCANSVMFLNSFDRVSIKENQARAVFLMSRDDAYRIFATYQTRGAYADALNRGVVYRATFLQLDAVEGDQEPYRVRFTSKLEIKDNDRPTVTFTIKSEGDLVKHTPQYPENQSGLYFTNYQQTFHKNTSGND